MKKAIVLCVFIQFLCFSQAASYKCASAPCPAKEKEVPALKEIALPLLPALDLSAVQAFI